MTRISRILVRKEGFRSCSSYPGAVSGGHRNNPSVGFARCQPVEGLSRPAIEPRRDRIELRRRQAAEVHALGEVLAQQAVGILVTAALPRAMRVAEVDLHPGVDGEALVL